MNLSLYRRLVFLTTILVVLLVGGNVVLLNQKYFQSFDELFHEEVEINTQRLQLLIPEIYTDSAKIDQLLRTELKGWRLDALRWNPVTADLPAVSLAKSERGSIVQWKPDVDTPGQWFHVKIQHKSSEFAESKNLGEIELFYKSFSAWDLLSLFSTPIIIALLATLLLLSGLLLVMLRNWLIKPLRKLSHLALLVSKGDFSSGLPRIKDPEMQHLIESFHQMRTSIRGNISALQEREEDLFITLNSLREAVVAIDSENRIRRVNSAAEALLDLTASQLVGRQIFELLELELAQGGESVDSMEVLESWSATGVDFLLSDRNLKNTRVSVSVGRLEDIAGGSKGAVIVFRDIGMQFQMQEELVQAQKMESLGRMAGTIAHDFNNLLSSIMGFAELAEMKLADDDPALKSIRQILKTGERATDLTAKLLAYGRKKSTELHPLDSRKLIQDVEQMLKAKLPDSGVDIHLQLNADHHGVLGDYSMLSNAVMNLGINACDAMEGRGRLDICTKNEPLRVAVEKGIPLVQNSVDREFLVIQVLDTGPGIPLEIRDQVFEPFFTTKPNGAGTGLGLAAVYNTVSKHKGWIQINDVPSGAEIEIWLPVSHAEIENMDNSMDESLYSGTKYLSNKELKPLGPGKERVLLVDDEAPIREMGKVLLESLGFVPVLAENGQVAVDFFKQAPESFRLVVLDAKMPVMDGATCFKELRKMRPDIPALMISGYVEKHVLDELLATGLDGFLAKPFRLQQMRDALERILQE